jgi:ribonucleoside-diphosphate reductase alpha chain
MRSLRKYLEIYARSTEFACAHADEWELSHPLKTRAIAPTGTIGIVAETTTGAECIFCVAYKRRYLKGQAVHYQYVIDPTAKNLIDTGVDPDSIEDAYVLAENIERRVEFQAWLQQYVDHGISSTLNLPAWGSEHNNEGKVREFGNMLIKHLPKLRGITVYPDGARGGQPLTPVRYQTAIKHVGDVFIEGTDVCDITKGSTCG